MQVAGLKHFDDMQHRIPRSEVEQVHSLVCGAVRDILGVEGLPDADRLHCRVTGSYIRGKPMTGQHRPHAPSQIVHCTAACCVQSIPAQEYAPQACF